MLLDEPTTGLDPQARHLVWERLYRLKRRGVGPCILTTHYMDEAEQLCDRLVIMDRSHIVAAGSPRELIDAHVTREVLEVRGIDERDLADLGTRTEQVSDRVLLYTDDADAAAAALHERGAHPGSLLVRRASLEDVFLTLTGRTLEE